jgi:DNA modification methylase
MIGESLLDGRVFLANGDSREVLRSLPDNSIDSIVTDPPYALVSIVKRFGGAKAKPAKAGKTGAFARSSKGFMGQKWDTGETAFCREFWAECLRVLKPGGHLAAFSGTRTQHHMAVAIELAGFEIRDDILNMIARDKPARQFFASLDDAQRSALIACLDQTSFTGLAAWCYGTGFPKSHNVSKAIDRHLQVEREVVGTETMVNDMRNSALLGVGKGGERPAYERNVTVATSAEAKEWDGYGTALKPAWEPIVIARKPISEDSVAANVLRWRTGAINVGACSVGKREKPKVTDPKHGGQAHNTYGKPSGGGKLLPDGRFPANLVHDGSREVVESFPALAGAAAPVKDSEPSKASEGNITGERGRVAGAFHGDRGSAARFYYSAKADSDDRAGSRHPTVKDVGLMMWLVRLVTPKGGVVLDPFAGSGTTGEACLAEGMTAILVEREAKFCDDIRRRMALFYAGPEERRNAFIAATGKVKDTSDLPLFGVAAE